MYWLGRGTRSHTHAHTPSAGQGWWRPGIAHTWLIHWDGSKRVDVAVWGEKLQRAPEIWFRVPSCVHQAEVDWYQQVAAASRIAWQIRTRAIQSFLFWSTKSALRTPWSIWQKFSKTFDLRATCSSLPLVTHLSKRRRSAKPSAIRADSLLCWRWWRISPPASCLDWGCRRFWRSWRRFE